MGKVAGRVVEVAGDDLRRIGRDLARHPDIVSVAQIGAHLRVLTVEGDGDAVALVAAAVRNHPGTRTQEARPNLEDVFVVATGGSGR